MSDLKEHRWHVHRTGNFQANRDSMPMRELQHNTKLEAFQLDYYSEDLLTDRTYLDAKGQLRCLECDLFAVDAPVTCKYCLQRKKHPKGRPSYGCRNGRCRGHLVHRDQGVLPPKDTSEDQSPDVEIEGEELLPRKR